MRRTAFIPRSSNKTDIMCNRSINCILNSKKSYIIIAIIPVTIATHTQTDYRDIILGCVVNAPLNSLDKVRILSSSCIIRYFNGNNISALGNTINAPTCSSNACNMRTMPVVIIRISIFSLVVRTTPSASIITCSTITILLNNPPAKVRMPIINPRIKHTHRSTAPRNIRAIHLLKPHIIRIHNRHALRQKRMYCPHSLNSSDIRIPPELLHLRPRNLRTDNINIIICMLKSSPYSCDFIRDIALGIHLFPENPEPLSQNLFILKIDKHFDLLIIQKSPVLCIVRRDVKLTYITTISPCKTQNTQAHIYKNNRQENDFAHI